MGHEMWHPMQEFVVRKGCTDFNYCGSSIWAKSIFFTIFCLFSDHR